MRVPLIIGGVIAAVLAVLAFVYSTLIGFGSPATMGANAKLLGRHWSEASSLGFVSAVGDTWLWGRCVRASGIAETGTFNRPYLTDHERSCGRSAMKRAEKLSKVGTGRAEKEAAIRWYSVANELSVPGDFESQVSFADRIITGDLPSNLFPGMESGTVRSQAVLTILIAAWHENGPAMVKAIDLLLQGNTPVEQVGMQREIEAYALLLQAKAKGQDVDERLGMVSLLLDTDVRFEIQDWLKATGRLPA